MTYLYYKTSSTTHTSKPNKQENSSPKKDNPDSKNDNKIGYFKTELIKVLTSSL